MAKPRILVVGSFNMDHTVTTSVFPNEGETVLGGTFSKALGGKGNNQAVQMARLGADVTVVGKLGRDSNGSEMLQSCKDEGMNTDNMLFDEETASGSCVIILEQAPGKQTKNRIIVTSGSNMTITPQDVAFLEEKVAEFDLVVLQLEIPMEINEIVAAYAFAKGVPVMLNSAPSAPLSDELLSHLTYISPNEHEACDLTGVHIEHSGKSFDERAAHSACSALKSRGVKNVLITIGEAGAVLDTEKDGFFHSPCAEGVTAADPTAAGDSFVGALCVGLCSGWDYNSALRFANHTAAITVSRLGAMPSLPTLGEVEAFMLQKGLTVPDTSCLK